MQIAVELHPYTLKNPKNQRLYLSREYQIIALIFFVLLITVLEFKKQFSIETILTHHI